MPEKIGIDRLELLVNADVEIAMLKAKLKKFKASSSQIKVS
jgi:hypothetical protein